MITKNWIPWNTMNPIIAKLVQLNPGTVTSLEFKEDGVTFKRAFLCPRSNQTAFRFCTPMVILDACHSRSQYGGVTLSTCGHDGEGRIVLLAIGLAEIKMRITGCILLRCC
jgi:hypothetical protein